ncbi:S-adenosyl-L-methionine-dependent methyltransferase [Dactylonectria macrodidyma]|uniref:S-adenosyl-L-methionine-dependent methyltransferase n=1 Tax=Dactylonectria macrodidyma TaxID=307937 RepID=A0A9P9FTJ6_9HYPO|nr:S-adenosyl-L-methionine-dependent methyltransferase [Dactylonectria macrodidyma]
MAEPRDEILAPETTENDEADHDSSVGEDPPSSTQSLESSIYNYREENGRTYHRYREGKYNLPNDEQEQERLDLQHHLFLLTFDDRLGLAPPNDPDFNPDRVLDLGTGTGIWAIDYSDEHPGTHVCIDLSPIQPLFVPPNVEFQVDDVEQDWTFEIKFDYVHSRMMTSSIASWSEYLQRIYDNLKPGGYFELQEADLLAKSDDGTLTNEHALSKWLEYLHNASMKLGRPYQDITKVKNIMADIGFVDIVETYRRWPMNTWPRDAKYKLLGAWTRENVSNGLEAFSMAPLTRALDWNKDEVTAFLANVRRDLNDKSIHAYWPVYSVYGRRP